VSCPFCLSTWVGLACVTALGCGGVVAELVGLGLALSRLTNVGNDPVKRLRLPEKPESQ